MNRTRVISVSLAIASAMLGMSAFAIDSQNMTSIAQTELMRALSRAYPEISSWTVTPLTSDSLRFDSLEKKTIATVLQTRARSAVRMQWNDRSGMHSRVIWFDVVGTENVLVTMRDTPARQPISSADVAVETRDVMAIHCSPLQTDEQIVGMRTKRALRSGATICAEHIEPQPFVARGEKVQVHYESTRVSLSTTGVAQQDGNIGQHLKVMNPSTKDSFTAIVSGHHEVTVHE